MIRVLHSVSNMDRAGIETMIMNFYRHIDRTKVQFDFLANKPKIGDYEDEIAQMGGRVFRSPGFMPTRFPKYVKYMKSIVAGEPKVDVVHVHNGALGLYALVAAKMCGVENRVYHAHGAKLPSGRGYAVKVVCRPLIDPFTKYKLACGLKAAKFYYHKSTIDSGNFTIVRNAIDTQRFAFNQASRDELREKYALEGKTVIGHVGRFSQQKNHQRIIEIFARLKKRVPDAVLVLIGEGDEYDATVKLVNDKGLKDDVRFIPPVSDIEKWYSAMDLFLFPSFWEGLPVVVIEAQTSGLGCVLSSEVTQECKVCDGVTFVGLDEDDEKWVDAIVKNLENRPDRIAADETVKNAGYDIRLVAKQLQDFYLSLAEK